MLSLSWEEAQVCVRKGGAHMERSNSLSETSRGTCRKAGEWAGCSLLTGAEGLEPF